MTNKKILILVSLLLVSFLVAGCGLFPPTELAVTGVTLDKTTLALTVGDAPVTLVATVEPEDATDPSVIWDSSAPAVATVDAGVVTPLTAGLTVITVTTVDGGFTDTCAVTVTAEVEPEPELTKIVVAPKTMTLFAGKSEKIKSVTATYEVKGVEVPIALDKCTFASSATTVATVSDTGLVTGVAGGTATITVSYGGKSDTLKVTVNPVLLTSIVVLPEAMTLSVRGSETITSVTAHYDDGSTTGIALGDCTYLSSDEEVATVLAGIISAIEVGEATITVTYAGMTDTLEVTVNSILLTSIVALPETMTLLSPGSETITSVTAHYSDGSTKIVTSDCDYVSSDTNVAKVTAFFEVEAVNFGTATITVTYMEEEITKTVFIEETDTIEVTVGPVHNITQDFYRNTIQEAIDDKLTSAGDTIEVAAGTYDHSMTLSIDKALTLLGPNTGINPNTGARVSEALLTGEIVQIRGNVNDVTIDGFKFEITPIASPPQAALFIGEFSLTFGTNEDITVQNNWFTGCDCAAVKTSYTYMATNLLVTDNKITDLGGVDKSGLIIWGAEYSEVSNNVIDGTTFGGMILADVDNVVVDGNTISNTPFVGIILCGAETVAGGSFGPVEDITISNNVIDNTNTGETLESGGILLQGNDITSTLFTGSVTVTGNTVTNSFNGLSVAFCDGTSITDWSHVNFNNFTDNSNAGVYVSCGDGTLDATDNWWGDASGPTYYNNPGGTGDEVSDNVDYTPWSTEEN